VTTEQVDLTTVAHFPVTDSAMAPYLSKAAFLPTDDPEIRKTALQIRGKTTDLYHIARSIRDWVHTAMTPDASIGVPRSANDIYRRRRGVCRDYATLYTAIARAAGLPTRMCSGIVYADGRFFYHAWAESYIGKWVAFDPTLFDPSHPVDYVDATHIKFSEGDATSVYDVVSIVGRLKIAIKQVDL
jgi:transglutaminase-like putative cysteine protease